MHSSFQFLHTLYSLQLDELHIERITEAYNGTAEALPYYKNSQELRSRLKLFFKNLTDEDASYQTETWKLVKRIHADALARTPPQESNSAPETQRRFSAVRGLSDSQRDGSRDEDRDSESAEVVVKKPFVLRSSRPTRATKYLGGLRSSQRILRQGIGKKVTKKCAKRFQCPGCDQFFSRLGNLHHHNRKYNCGIEGYHDYIWENAEKKARTINADGTRNCVYCGEYAITDCRFSTYHVIEGPKEACLEKQKREARNCKYCRTHFMTRSGLIFHLQKTICGVQHLDVSAEEKEKMLKRNRLHFMRQRDAYCRKVRKGPSTRCQRCGLSVARRNAAKHKDVCLKSNCLCNTPLLSTIAGA